MTTLNSFLGESLTLSPSSRAARVLGLALLVSALAACASGNAYKVRMVIPPAFLEAGRTERFSDPAVVDHPDDPRVLYATLRAPAMQGTGYPYSTGRATGLRLGVARVTIAKDGVSWTQMEDMQFVKEHANRIPLEVASVDEFGVLDRAQRPLAVEQAVVDPGPRERYTAAINDRLARSKSKDIYIYVHGYRVTFENPVLTASELWHFLDYDGVFIPFGWPARTNRLAYFGDVESSHYAAPYLRNFIEYLAHETDVRKIHILAYSAGTRLVADTLFEIALANKNRSEEEIHADLRLGNVIMAASDLDRDVFANYVNDGMLRVAQHMTIYESANDKALRIVDRIFGAERLGQLVELNLAPPAREFLRTTNSAAIVSVARTTADSGNGHHYFQYSPLVSSDVIATLRYGLLPAARGLVRVDDSLIWTFPESYLQTLQAACLAADAKLAQQTQQTHDAQAGTP